MVSIDPRGSVRLIAVGAASRSTWERVVRTDPTASIRQTPLWGDCIRLADGLLDATRAYQTVDGRQLVLPLVRGRYLPARLASDTSWPGGWGHCGLLGTGGRLTAADVAGVVADLRSSPALRTRVPVPATSADTLWAPCVPADVLRSRYHTHVLNLAGGFDTVWRTRFASTVRSAARKAHRQGVTVETSTDGRLLRIFDPMYRDSVERWAKARRDRLILAQLRARHHEPLRKFQIVAELLKDACEVHIAWLDGRPLAGIIVLTYGAVANYWRGAMDKHLIIGTGANELLHRVAIERACARGCQQYDMQRSPSPGVATFKSKFGADPAEIVEYGFENLPVTALELHARAVARRLLGRPPA